MCKNASLSLFLSLLMLAIIQPVAAQSGGPVYIVQPGDTLFSIAARFNVTVADLEAANPTINPDLLSPGQQLVIPGLEGVTGILDTKVISFGDTLRSISRRTQVPSEQLVRLNRMVSPTELYMGISMIVPAPEGKPELSSHASVSPDETLLELAVKQGSTPWELASINNLAGTWDALPNDVLYSQSGASIGQATGLPSAFLDASIKPLPLTQGNTEVIKVQTPAGVTLSGTWIDKPLYFFQTEDGQVALQGIHAMLEPGLYPLKLEATLPDGTRQSVEQMILVESGNYPKEALSVSTEFIDPTVTKPEDEQVANIVAPVTANKLWQGSFGLPVYVPEGQDPCIFDRYGTRRSFNGSDYDYFHSGIDFGVCFAENAFDIYAAAPGTVVFAGPLTVRGNATFIDHGWGIYTAYFHQKEIDVTVGQQVQAGQLIGLIGATGRVTGPHLHWEVWVNGIQVNPMNWLNQAYP